MRKILFALCFSVVPAMPVLAGAVTFITRAPYDPRHVPVSVDQAQLTGELSEKELQDLIRAGKELFVTKFTSADGEGRPTATQAIIPTHFKHPRDVLFQRASGPDANSCASCHNDPLPGGAGDFTVNVFTSEGTESADFDSVDPQFSNERNTNSMFGDGLVELLAREMTADLQQIERKAVASARDSAAPVTVDLVTKGVSFGKLTAAPDGTLDVSGVEGIDKDLVVRPFSQKGVITSMRMFTVTALNAHHGMQADERFGPQVTGEDDFDGDGVRNEVPPGLVSALVAFQASLPAPLEEPYADPQWQAMSVRGKELFGQIGCSSCHMEQLPLKSLKFQDPGPYDTAGTLRAADVKAPAIYDLAQLDWVKALPRDAEGNVLVPLFGDLKRHVIADTAYPHFANEVQSQGFVARDSFITAELWGVADTAPYGHRGDLSTLAEAVLNHGGEGRRARDAFAALPQDQQNDIITFLMSLRSPR